MLERNALFKELRGIGVYGSGIQTAPAEAEVRIDPTDVRIDVRAKFSLQRMLRQGRAAAQDAEGMVTAINTGQLAGIDGDDTLRAVHIARQLGTQRWLLVPHGKDAELVCVPAGPPSIVFREGLEKDKNRFDMALRTAWRLFSPGPVAGIPDGPLPTLTSGSQGPYVVFLQRRLNVHGADLIEDGVWGLNTSKSLLAFQKRHKLAEDDVAGRATWRSLKKAPSQRSTSLTNNEIYQPTPQSANHPFSPFVTTGGSGVLDQGIADLLFDLYQKNRQGTMAHQVAVFAHHELANGNLVGIVRYDNSDKIKNRLSAEHHPRIDEASEKDVKPEKRMNGKMVPIRQGTYIRGFIFMNDVLLDVISPPEPQTFGSCQPFGFTTKMPRGCFDFALLILAHELTHFRNRVPTKMDTIDIQSSGQFVAPVLAASEPNTVQVRKMFIHELGGRHVAWHVKLDLLHLKKRPPLLPGQFFRAALLLSLDVNSYNNPKENAYMKKLSEDKKLTDLSDQYRKQVALWMRSMDELLFHDDAAQNEAIRNRIEVEYHFAEQTNFKLPNTLADGLI